MTDDKLKKLLIECKKDKTVNFIVDYWDRKAKNPKEWRVVYFGPKGSPYEGGIFTVKVVFKEDYPSIRPDFYFITKIYHLNIDWFTKDCKGKVCFGHYAENDIKKLLRIVNTYFTSQNTSSTWYGDDVKKNYEDYVHGRSKVFYEEAQRWVYLYAGLRELNK